jgi:hypothetical protein
VWAVGSHPNPQDPDEDGTLAEHWDGTRWTVVPSPSEAEQDNVFFGVAALGPGDVWAVGQHKQPFFEDEHLLVEHWDGRQWSFSPAPPASFDDTLEAVDGTGPADVWAVGAFNTGGTSLNKSLIEHWNGSAWTIVDHPHVGDLDFLHHVVAIAPDDAWAVGSFYSSADFRLRTLTLHWNGSTWSVVPSPNVEEGVQSNSLWGVSAVSSTDAWAVGRRSDPDGPFRDATLALHWDGSAWSVIPSVDVGDHSRMFDVSARARGEVWAVGDVDSGTDLLPLTERWNGSRFRGIRAPRDAGVLHGIVSLARTDAWAVGLEIVHWNGTAWQIVPD